MNEDFDTEGDVNYWPSVSDLFLTLAIIMTAMLGVVFYILVPKSTAGVIQKDFIVTPSKITNPTNKIRDEINLEPVRIEQGRKTILNELNNTADASVQIIQDLKEQITQIEQEQKDLKKLNEKLEAKLNDKPPIIRIDEERKEYRFSSGSALISDTFSKGLNNVEFKRLADEILKRNSDGSNSVDTLEIIGHTDGVPISIKGNLDKNLPNLLSGNTGSLYSLKAGSNNDLGLLRALAVKQEWQKYVTIHESAFQLKELEVRCYSAGQTILPDKPSYISTKSFTKNDPKARRIEMRLTRLKGTY